MENVGVNRRSHVVVVVLMRRWSVSYLEYVARWLSYVVGGGGGTLLEVDVSVLDEVVVLD